MRLHQESHAAVDLRDAGTVLTYTHLSSLPATVLVRATLGGTGGPIAGGGAYTLKSYINGVVISPVAVVSVGGGVTATAIQSRHLLLAEDDTLTVTATGLVGDAAVRTLAELFDVTPAQLEELTGGGQVAVDHNYDETDALRVVDPEGRAVDHATIRAYRQEDYAAGYRSARYILGESETKSDGRWRLPILLDPGDYTLLLFKQGMFKAKALNLQVVAGA